MLMSTPVILICPAGVESSGEVSVPAGQVQD
jgi:hypothetical protein